VAFGDGVLAHHFEINTPLDRAFSLAGNLTTAEIDFPTACSIMTSA
jgi:hypothetical protein